ncbi:MAG: proline dehydrogenase family protein, partial [Pseudomonadota bacterium]|nr:proline dehydrogenase family protein [Pseudomonadota bacterium]
MIFVEDRPTVPPWRDALAVYYRKDEEAVVSELLQKAALDNDARERIAEQARALVRAVRTGRRRQGGIDALMQEYDLTTQEGLLLMCLAEALLRIPDGETADALIADKLLEADWSAHLNRSDSLFVNASTFGLMLTGRMIEPSELSDGRVRRVWQGLVRRSSEPVVRQAVRQSMRILGHQFVLGRTIDEALQRAAKNPAYRYSFDMLGEAARTTADAERYLHAYLEAIRTLAKSDPGQDPVSGPGISVKLSA